MHICNTGILLPHLLTVDVDGPAAACLAHATQSLEWSTAALFLCRLVCVHVLSRGCLCLAQQPGLCVFTVFRDLRVCVTCMPVWCMVHKAAAGVAAFPVTLLPLPLLTSCFARPRTAFVLAGPHPVIVVLYAAPRAGCVRELDCEPGDTSLRQQQVSEALWTPPSG